MTMVGVYKEAALEVWTGLPGGGKSYCAAQLQVEWLEKGHPVVTNLRVSALPFSVSKDLLPGKLRADRGEYVLADDEAFSGVDPVLDDQGKPIMIPVVDAFGQQTYDRHGQPKYAPKVKLKLLKLVEEVQARNPNKHCLVLIDEAHNYYPASNTMATAGTPDAIKVFLRQHRHMHVSIVAVVQNHAMLNNNFLRLAQCFRHHKNLVKDSVLEILLWWFGDNFHLAYSMANQGGKPFTREKFARKWFRIRKKRASFYSTIQMHASDLQGSIVRVRGKTFRLVWLLLFLSVMFSLWRVTRKIFKGKPVAHKAAVTAAPVKDGKVPATLQAIEAMGGLMRLAVTDSSGERFVFEPYTDERFWDLDEKIGQTIRVPGIEGSGRTVGEMLYE